MRLWEKIQDPYAKQDWIGLAALEDDTRTVATQTPSSLSCAMYNRLGCCYSGLRMSRECRLPDDVKCTNQVKLRLFNWASFALTPELITLKVKALAEYVAAKAVSSSNADVLARGHRDFIAETAARAEVKRQVDERQQAFLGQLFFNQ
jgi:hypothetical protein